MVSRVAPGVMSRAQVARPVVSAVTMTVGEFRKCRQRCDGFARDEGRCLLRCTSVVVSEVRVKTHVPHVGKMLSLVFSSRANALV